MSQQKATAHNESTAQAGFAEVLSLHEFRNQYMTRVLTLVDMDLDQAVSTLGVTEQDVLVCLERT